MFDWQGFKRGEFVVNCKTEGSARNFLDKCYQNNIKWSSKNYYNRTYFDDYGKSTCYRNRNYGLVYDNKDFYESNNFKIIEWEEEQ